MLEIAIILGFKSEWATVKDEMLYVGSMGKEWTTSSGEFEHNNPLWIKVVSPGGETHALDWIHNYKRLRQSIDIEFPGKHKQSIFLYTVCVCFL